MNIDLAFAVYWQFFENRNILFVFIIILFTFLCHKNHRFVLIRVNKNIIILSNSLIIFSIFSIIFFYIVSPGYIDHLQHTVSSIGFAALAGAPIYPPVESQLLYGMLYGPLAFLFFAVPVDGMLAAGLLENPSSAVIPVTKLIGAAAALAGTYFVWRRSVTPIDSPARKLTVYAFILLFTVCAFSPLSISNKPDSFLFLFSAISIFVSARTSNILRSLVIISVLAALGSAMKLHAAIYIIPAGLLLLFLEKSFRKRLAFLALALLIYASLVFLFIDVSAGAREFYRYIIYASHHGFDPALVEANLEITAVATSLLVAGYILAGRKPTAGETCLLAGIAVSFAVAVASGAKVGSGPHHLLPLTPYVVFLLAHIVGAPGSRRHAEGATDSAWTLFTLAALLCHAQPILTTARDIATYYSVAPAARDLRTLLRRYGDAEIGIGGEGVAYHHYWLKAIQVAHNRRLTIDSGPLMDLQRAGFTTEGYRARIKSCATRQWIIPGGEPWSLNSWYDGRPLFSEGFREDFDRHYEKVHTGTAFTVWICRNNEPASPPLRSGAYNADSPDRAATLQSAAGGSRISVPERGMRAGLPN